MTFECSMSVKITQHGIYIGEKRKLMTGIVFDIQRFSIHDGPGIRTTVFFKGCNLRCFWCHNPEGMCPKPELQFTPEKCIGCGECALICPNDAQHIEAGQREFKRELCQVCGQCTEVCYPGGLALVGKEMTVDQVMAEILKDRPFYETSKGGVTLSGGEPLVQREFAAHLLRACKTEGIHTAIETAGNYPWEHLAPLLRWTDLIMMDIKHMDSDKHRQATGVPNHRILETARRLAQSDQAVTIRVPVVPTVNDTPAEIAAIAQFVDDLAGLRAHYHQRDLQTSDLFSLELLPFHRLASNKYESLGYKYQARALAPLGNMEELQAVVQRHRQRYTHLTTAV
jgi:pyruvate formate lyase activating enzyme